MRSGKGSLLPFSLVPGPCTVRDTNYRHGGDEVKFSWRFQTLAWRIANGIRANLRHVVFINKDVGRTYMSEEHTTRHTNFPRLLHQFERMHSKITEPV